MIRFKPLTHQQVYTALFLLISFALSRLVFWLIGVRFDSTSLDWFWQYLDVDVLRHRLFSGIFHQHSQPPGFNLFLGTVLKLCPNSFAVCFNVIYLLMGFVLYCLLYLFLRFSKFSRIFSLAAAFLFIVSPGSILYENWLFYTYPIAVLLVLAAVVLLRLQDKPTASHVAVFLIVISIICLTRSTFHLIFLMIIISLILISCKVNRRKIVVYSIVAVCLASSLYVKNLVVFGFFGSSSWAGMNVFRLAEHSVGENIIDKLVQDNRIPKTASIPPFSHVDKYSEFQSSTQKYKDVPELTTPIKVSGTQNYNHIAYVSVAQDYKNASLYIIQNYQRLYLSGMFDSWLLYCQPTWQDRYLMSNANTLSKYISLLSAVRLRIGINLQSFKKIVFGVDNGKEPYALTSLLFVPLILLFAVVGSIKRFYKLIRHDDTSGLTFIFMSITVLYVAIISNAMEYGENNRFRAETDPLIFLLGIIIVKDVYYFFKDKWLRKNFSDDESTRTL